MYNSHIKHPYGFHATAYRITAFDKALPGGDGAKYSPVGTPEFDTKDLAAEMFKRTREAEKRGAKAVFFRLERFSAQASADAAKQAIIKAMRMSRAPNGPK